MKILDNDQVQVWNIAWLKGRTQGETIMRKFIISITTLAALTTFLAPYRDGTTAAQAVASVS